MLFQINTQPMGVIQNPLIFSLYSANFNEGGFPLPPSSDLMVTEVSGELMVTESGNYMITE